jgi:hypothetical protein
VTAGRRTSTTDWAAPTLCCSSLQTWVGREGGSGALSSGRGSQHTAAHGRASWPNMQRCGTSLEY